MFKIVEPCCSYGMAVQMGSIRFEVLPKLFGQVFHRFARWAEGREGPSFGGRWTGSYNSQSTSWDKWINQLSQPEIYPNQPAVHLRDVAINVWVWPGRPHGHESHTRLCSASLGSKILRGGDGTGDPHRSWVRGLEFESSKLSPRVRKVSWWLFLCFKLKDPKYINGQNLLDLCWSCWLRQEKSWGVQDVGTQASARKWEKSMWPTRVMSWNCVVLYHFLGGTRRPRPKPRAQSWF